MGDSLLSLGEDEVYNHKHKTENAKLLDASVEDEKDVSIDHCVTCAD